MWGGGGLGHGCCQSLGHGHSYQTSMGAVALVVTTLQKSQITTNKKESIARPQEGINSKGNTIDVYIHIYIYKIIYVYAPCDSIGLYQNISFTISNI